MWAGADLDGVVGSSDERDEEAQHHVDEEADEGVEVELGEEPDEAAPALLSLHCGERHEHVVPVDEREQALRHHGQRAKLPAGQGGCGVRRAVGATGGWGRGGVTGGGQMEQWAELLETSW